MKKRDDNSYQKEQVVKENDCEIGFFSSQSNIGVKDANAPAKLVALRAILDTYVKLKAKKAKKNFLPPAENLGLSRNNLKKQKLVVK